MAYCNESFIDGLTCLPSEELPSEEPQEELSKFLSEIEKELLAQELYPSSDLANQDFSISDVPRPPPFRKKSIDRNKRQKTKSKPDSGLRRFSKEVIEKVKQKGVTSFDEVADEMFKSMPTCSRDDSSTKCAQKNVRRRVYDILNVLVAMEIITKDRKEITWVGIPSEIPDEQLQLQQEKKEVEESIQQKTADIQQLILKQIAYKNLLQSKIKSTPQHAPPGLGDSTVHLPFIAVRTSKNTVITHTTSEDKLEHVFNFTQPFQIEDNMEVLMRMGMAFGLENNTCSKKNLEISRTMVSKELESHLEVKRIEIVE